MNRKIFIPLLYCSTLLTSINSSAQQFINGGFEPALGIAPCTDIDVKVYNKNMNGNWSTGGGTTMQIANSTCSAGAPVAGSFFGVMKYAPPMQNNIIVFKLDKPLTANKLYSFSLSYKIPAPTTATGVLRFGYASDSTKADSISGYTDPMTNTAWVKDTLTFTPKQAWQYVWVEVTALAGDPFTVHIDDVSMILAAANTSVQNLSAGNAIHLAPNPFFDKTVLTVDRYVSLPYHIAVYDITGRLVVQKNNVQENSITIDKSSIGTGMYILKVTDNDQHIYTSRLSAQ